MSEKRPPLTQSRKKDQRLHWLPIGTLKTNPANPRTITKDQLAKLVKSLREFPQMLELRPLVIDSLSTRIVLGGNMRLEAAKVAKLDLVPCLSAEDLTESQRQQFIIKDNISGGAWDWDILANEWDANELADWGLDFPAPPDDQDKAASGPVPSLKIIFVSADEAQAAEVPLRVFLNANFPNAVIK